MNKEEERILHGLNFINRGTVGEEMLYEASEINWLIKSKLKDGNKWRGRDGKLQSIDDKSDDYLQSFHGTKYAVKRALAYLQDAGYIQYKFESPMFRIAITGKGVDLARELDTRIGKLNLLYKKNKDGILWFVATVLVSIVTTLITKCA